MFRTYDVLESGRLSFDGEVLSLVGEHESRTVTDDELDVMQPVVPGNAIPACNGFDFFLLQPAQA
jgi:hypothetical protein